MEVVDIFELSFYVLFDKGGYTEIVFLLLMSKFREVMLTLWEPAFETSQLGHLVFDDILDFTINFYRQIFDISFVLFRCLDEGSLKIIEAFLILLSLGGLALKFGHDELDFVNPANVSPLTIAILL